MAGNKFFFFSAFKKNFIYILYKPNTFTVNVKKVIRQTKIRTIFKIYAMGKGLPQLKIRQNEAKLKKK